MFTIGHKTLMSLFDFWREHLSLVLNSANEKPLILTISEAMSTIGHKTLMSLFDFWREHLSLVKKFSQLEALNLNN